MSTLTPLNRLARYEAWLAGAAVVGVLGGFMLLYMAPPIAWLLLGLGFVALVGVLISYPIRTAAAAILERSPR